MKLNPKSRYLIHLVPPLTGMVRARRAWTGLGWDRGDARSGPAAPGCGPRCRRLRAGLRVALLKSATPYCARRLRCACAVDPAPADPAPGPTCPANAGRPAAAQVQGDSGLSSPGAALPFSLPPPAQPSPPPSGPHPPCRHRPPPSLSTVLGSLQTAPPSPHPRFYLEVLWRPLPSPFVDSGLPA